VDEFLQRRPRIAICAGDPAGIGPDIVLALAAHSWPAALVVIADREMLTARAALLGLDVVFLEDDGRCDDTAPGVLRVLHQPLATGTDPTHPNPANGAAVLATLRRAAEGCLSGEFAAMVTAPVSKAVISDSGTPFSGHTEYLAELTGSESVVMLLAAGELRVALATTHLPLSEVPAAISAQSLEQTLRTLDADLRRKFALESPRISVLGLNPHAGEGGKLGREEIEVITPVLEKLRAEGLQLRGPLPADTAFGPALRADTDAYLAMYHDQGLPVLKAFGFGGAVNITLGLPIIRTSVDHGTAFELAGTGKASSGSMFAAVEQALALLDQRM
jgi:4-hydroxythreonine-4-phosphate dehydrogenase